MTFRPGKPISESNPQPVLAQSAGGVVDVIFSSDTAAIATGDVLADTQVVADALRVAGGFALLQSIVITDGDDQGTALDLVFFRANTSLGTENSAPDITDSEAVDILGIISIATGDYIDLGLNRVATKTAVGLVLEGNGSTTDIWVAAIVRGSATFASNGLKAKFGLIQS
jgi:hypothetical protein